MKNVDKSAFLDVLMGNTKSINVDETVKSKADSAPKDSVSKLYNFCCFRSNDFMQYILFYTGGRSVESTQRRFSNGS